jgi:hypothetical protein
MLCSGPYSALLTQEELHKELNYCKETGKFTWRCPNKYKKYPEAGSITLQGYRRIKLKGKFYPAAKLAFLYVLGAFPTSDVVYINRDKEDTSFKNLREATESEKSYNRALSYINTSGMKGVSYVARREKYSAQVQVNGARVTKYFPGTREGKQLANQWAIEKREELWKTQQKT